ncbi:MAG: hypothetical protein R2867_05245 [Caldilineaceae bacterium]
MMSFLRRTPDPLRIAGITEATGIRALVRTDGIIRSLPVIAWAVVRYSTWDDVEGVILENGRARLVPLIDGELVRYEETEVDHG